ncbi:MAG: DNA adenine methylase [Acholeplasma sp.]|nr:DNA adenine methylase [Acholeplasma sp.]
MIKAPFRWAGSKAKITSELFKYFKDSDTYIEPFLGSGVVLFRLIQDRKYKRYIVNDINVAIIEFYRAIKDNPKSVVDLLRFQANYYNNISSIELKKEFYYIYKKSFNEDKYRWGCFWLLMKTGFNGLYRENKKGEYNVPFGYKEKITFDESQIYEIHNLIQNVQFYCMDYRHFINLTIAEIAKMENRVFMYNDPPYCNSQRYTKEDFSNEALATYLKSLNIDVAISDVDNKTSKKIYKDFFKVIVKDTKRVINIASIQQSREVLFINYDLEGLLK